MARYLKLTIEVIEENYDHGITISKTKASHPQRWLLSHDRDRAEVVKDIQGVAKLVAEDMIEEFL